MMLPWNDRRGRLVPIKAWVFSLCFVPALVLAARWQADALGPRPFDEAIHVAGLWAIRFLLIALAVTPLRALFDWPRIALVRRMLGLTALAYTLLHFTLYVADQGFSPVIVAIEIARRFYLTIGFAALLGLAVLGVTSTDGWLRRLRGNWQRLHRIAYPLAAIALLHFFLQSKANVGEAVLMSGCFAWLMLVRLVPTGRRREPGPLLALAAGATLLTAAFEFGWYALATGINPWRVLAANLDVGFGLRPAHWVGLAGLAVLLAVCAVRAWRRWPAPAISGGD